MEMFHYSEDFSQLPFQNIIELYRSVGWLKYAESPEELKTALQNSSYVCVCLCENEIIGLIRSLSDGISIHYIQDLLVAPNFQRHGIGKCLVEKAIKRFAQAKVTALITDSEDKQKDFYNSLSFENLSKLKKRPMNCYIKRSDIDLFL